MSGVTLNQMLLQALSPVSAKNPTQLRPRQRKFLTDFEKELSTILSIKDFENQDLLNYLMRRPIAKYPFLRSNLAQRNALFVKSGITSYKFVQPIVDLLDAANNANGISAQCYTPALWLTIFKDAFKDLDLSNEKVVAVADPTRVKNEVFDLLMWIFAVVREMRLEGSLIARTEQVTIYRTKKIIIEGVGSTPAQESYTVESRVLYFDKKYSKAAEVKAAMFNKKFNFSLLIDFKKNLYLKKDVDTMAIIVNEVDNLLNAIMPTSEPGHIRKMRMGKVQRIASIFSQVISTVGAVSNFETLSFPTLRQDAPEPEIRKQPQQPVRAVTASPTAKVVSALDYSKASITGENDKPRTLTLGDMMDKANNKYPEGLDLETATSALKGIMDGRFLSEKVAVYLTLDGKLSLIGSPTDMGKFVIIPDPDLKTSQIKFVAA